MKKGIAILILLATCSLEAQEPLEVLQFKLDSISQHQGLMGFGVSVFSKDSVYFTKGYGHADFKKAKPYTPNTIQNIGSVSKTFIGVAIMKAVEMGLFQLDTPINDLIPFTVIHPKHKHTPITIRHLANHTSGIIDDEKKYERSYVLENPEMIPLSDYDRETAKYIETFLYNKKMPLESYLEAYLSKGGGMYAKGNFSDHAPGQKFEYSNIGAGLAAYCVAQATGKSFDTFTKEIIFDVLGMDDTGWSFSSIDLDKHAQVYTEKLVALPRYSLITYPDGGLRTSISSLTKYMQAMIRGYEGDEAILKTSSYKEMMKGHLKRDAFDLEEDEEFVGNYGIFWDFNRNNRIGHDGGDPGILTLMFYYKDTGMGAIFFTNTDVDGDEAVVNQVRAGWSAIKDYQKQLAGMD